MSCVVVGASQACLRDTLVPYGHCRPVFSLVITALTWLTKGASRWQAGRKFSCFFICSLVMTKIFSNRKVAFLARWDGAS